MSRLVGKVINKEIINKYNGGWIRLIEFKNLTMIGGLELNCKKFDGSLVNYIQELIVYNNETGVIIYSTGNNLRIADNTVLNENFDTIIEFIYYHYDFENNKFKMNSLDILDRFIYNIEGEILIKRVVKEYREEENNKLRHKANEKIDKENKQLFNEVKEGLEKKGYSISFDEIGYKLGIIRMKNLTNQEEKRKEAVTKIVFDFIFKNDSEKIERFKDKFDIVGIYTVENVDLINSKLKSIKSSL